MNVIEINESDDFGDAFEFLSGIKSLVAAGLIASNYDDAHTTLFDEAFSVSPMGSAYPSVLKYLGEYLTPRCVFSSAFSINQQCHAIAALEWFHNPAELEIHTGIVDKKYFHTWIYVPKSNTVIEPTPYQRHPGNYYGVKLANPEVFFAKQKKSRFEELYKYACEMTDGGNRDWQSRKDALARALKHE